MSSPLIVPSWSLYSPTRYRSKSSGYLATIDDWSFKRVRKLRIASALDCWKKGVLYTSDFESLIEYAFFVIVDPFVLLMLFALSFWVCFRVCHYF